MSANPLASSLAQPLARWCDGPAGAAPRIESLVALGTSITNNGTDSLGGGTGYLSTRSCGLLPVAQTVLNHSFSMAARTNGYSAAGGSPDLDHGYSGYDAVKLLHGDASYPGIIPMDDACATHADAMVIEAGANDTAQTAATMASRIVALWDAAAPHFKKIFAVNVLPQGAALGATIRDKIVACNALLATAAAARSKVVLFDAHTAFPKDGSGYGDASYLDGVGVHPVAASGIIVGKALAEVLLPHITGTAYTIPGSSSELWLTSNRLTTGSASLPTGWVAGSGTGVSYQEIDETGTGGHKWQRFLGTPTNSGTVFCPYQAVTPQCEAVYANAANSNTGNASVTVRHSLLPSGAKTISFAVSAGDTASQWTEKMRAALAADTDIAAAFAVAVASSTILHLKVKTPDRTDRIFSPVSWSVGTAGIQPALPGVSASTGWQRWTTSLFSLGGYRAGDVIRGTAKLRNASGSTSLGCACNIVTGSGKTAHALGYPASLSPAIETVDGLYLTHPTVVPPSCEAILFYLNMYASGAASFDARDAGIFIET